MGLEPTQAEAYKNLNLARLPIPTLPHDHYLCYQVFAEMSMLIFKIFEKILKTYIFPARLQKYAGTLHLHEESLLPSLYIALHEYKYDDTVLWTEPDQWLS